MAVRAVEHAVVKAEIAGLLPHPLHHRVPGREFGLVETEMQPTRPMMPDGNPGLARQLLGESRPFIRRLPRPALVMWRSVPLALHPDEPEIAARGAERDIALIQQCRLQPSAGEPIGDRRTDQPAADHNRIVTLHPPSRNLPPSRS